MGGKMAGRKVYQGHSSCYAKKEGVWIPDKGVSPRTLPSFIALILRDLKRGYTYQQGTCRKIRMDEKLALKRLNYLIALSKKHYGGKAKKLTEKSLRKLVSEFKLPRGSVKLTGDPSSLKRVVSELKGMFGSKLKIKAHAVEGEKRRAKAVVA
jgi:tRNA A37 methylthiotransferase MiaB